MEFIYSQNEKFFTSAKRYIEISLNILNSWLRGIAYNSIHFPGGASGKESTCQCRRHKRQMFKLWIGKIPWRRAWQPTLVFLRWESHGQMSLADYSPCGCEESDTTEVTQHAYTHTHTHTHNIHFIHNTYSNFNCIFFNLHDWEISITCSSTVHNWLNVSGLVSSHRRPLIICI